MKQKRENVPLVGSSPFLLLMGFRRNLYGSDDFAGLHAFRADFSAFRRVVLHDSNALQVRQPSPLRPLGTKSPGPGVNVSNVLSELGPLAADLTSVCHIGVLQKDTIAKNSRRYLTMKQSD